MESNRNRGRRRWLDALLASQAPPRPSAQTAYWQLVSAVRAHSQLLKPDFVHGPTNRSALIAAIDGLRRVSRCHRLWRRAPCTWTGTEQPPRQAWRHLVAHLFEDYAVPDVVRDAWHRVPLRRRDVELYVHLARGRSVRKFAKLLPDDQRMTKRTAQHFMCAPPDMTVDTAYRYAHARSLGAAPARARLLARLAPLGRPTNDEAFWSSVIRFLIRHEPISDQECAEIVSFVHAQRFAPAEITWGVDAGSDPVQPDFAMAGRSLRSLRRYMLHWRHSVAHRMPAPPRATPWVRARIQPFAERTPDGLWTINELLTDHELRVEGGMMQHCVGVYVHDCARRYTTIWSMKLTHQERCQRILTIEVLPRSRTIYQARGKRNAAPSPRAREMMLRWADASHLHVPPRLLRD